MLLGGFMDLQRFSRLCAGLFVVTTVLGATSAAANECLLNWDKENLRLEAVSGPVSGNDDDRYSVEDSGAICGKDTSFLDTYKLASNTISIAIGGQTHRFMPLAFYDKNRPHKCNQIKVRNACYRLTRNGNQTEIVLFDQDVQSKGTATFSIDDGGRISGTHPEFALIRAEFGVRNAVRIPARIRDRVNAFEKNAKSCAAHKRSETCLSNKEAVAEATALERLRDERFWHIASRDVSGDWNQFNSKFGALTGMPRVIQMMMQANEIGPRSPYELSDATAGASALSFGVRQLDIGGNTVARQIFSANLKDFATNDAWSTRSEHKAFVYQQAFQAPILKYRVRQLYLMHDAMPVLQDLMRSATAKERLDGHHRDFLAEEARRYAQLRQRCMFKDSPFLALVAIDRHNQRPKDYEPILDTVAAACNRKTLATVEDDVAAFYGRYRSRADKIRNLIRDERLQ